MKIEMFSLWTVKIQANFTSMFIGCKNNSIIIFSLVFDGYSQLYLYFYFNLQIELVFHVNGNILNGKESIKYARNCIFRTF